MSAIEAIYCMTRRCLITGAQGFVARYFVPELLACLPQTRVLGIGRSPDQNSVFHHTVSRGGQQVPAPIPEDLRFVDRDRYSYIACELSSTNLKRVIRDFDPTVVVHLAASLRGMSEDLIWQNNTQGTETFLSAIRAASVELDQFIFVSSGGVYAMQQDLPLRETSAARPIDTYSRSKLVSEERVRSFGSESRTRTVIARVFNVLGPAQDELHVAGRFAGQIAAILAGQAEAVIQTGPLSRTRDFLDVRDVGLALVAILESKLEGIVNVASGAEVNVGALLQIFLEAAGLASSVDIRQDAIRQDPVFRHFGDIERLTRTGFTPQHQLDRTCRDMLDYYARLIYE